MAAPADLTAWALPAARAVHDAALTLLFGGLLFPAYALPEDRRDIPPPLLATLRVEAWLALVSAAAVFALGVGGMAGSIASAADLSLLTATALDGEFGWLFLARGALLLACAILLLRRRPDALPLWLSGAALAALALTGHAREGEGAPMLAHVGLDALHLLCAGLWLGALPWFGWVLSSRSSGEEAAAVVRRFSAVASLAVALLLLSGVGATLLLVGSPLALPGTLWGRLLLVKIGLAGAMIGLAAHNRWRGTPGLATGDARAAAILKRNARWELALGLVVIALVGAIGTLPFDGAG